LETKHSNCRNCDATVAGAYCQNCGQRTSIHKVTIKETFQDFIATAFSVDAPFFVTLKLLFINPGRLFRDYLDGKRKRYYKPVAFFILMTIVYLLIRSLINFDPFTNTALRVSDDTEGQLLIQAGRFMLINIDKLLFAFVFTLALFMKLLFFRKRTFAEFLAISFFLLGAYTLFTTLNMFFVTYSNSNFQFLHITLMSFYFVYAMISFFQKRKLIAALKSVIVLPMALMSYVSLAYALSYLIVWIKNS
jgi:hypothetical protein